MQGCESLIFTLCVGFRGTRASTKRCSRATSRAVAQDRQAVEGSGRDLVGQDALLATVKRRTSHNPGHHPIIVLHGCWRARVLLTTPAHFHAGHHLAGWRG